MATNFVFPKLKSLAIIEGLKVHVVTLNSYPLSLLLVAGRKSVRDAIPKSKINAIEMNRALLV